jgi:hypothetical protein
MRVYVGLIKPVLYTICNTLDRFRIETFFKPLFVQKKIKIYVKTKHLPWKKGYRETRHLRKHTLFTLILREE